MKAEIVFHPYIKCPHCGKDDGFSCGHILAGETRQFGPWHCDNCGRSIVGRLGADGTIDIERHTEQLVKVIDLLVLKPQTKPVYFVLDAERFRGAQWQNDDDDEQDSARSLYETHSCPINWLRPAMVYYDGDADPHGLIEFVERRDASEFPSDETFGPNDRDRAFVALIERHESHTARAGQEELPPA